MMDSFLNTFVLLAVIILFFAIAFYDQFLIDKLKGKTRLKVRLLRRNKIEGAIFIVLLIIAVAQANWHTIEPFTLFLLSTFAILIIYHFFIRYPTLSLKDKGFFFANMFITYDKINTINVTEDGFLQFVLKNGKALPIYIENVDDVAKVLQSLVELGLIDGGKKEE